jgi:dihydroneopterin aldolase
MAPEGSNKTPVITASPLSAVTDTLPDTSRYCVHIRDLMITMLIGVHDHERREKQRVRLNLDIECDYPADGFCENYDRVYCYETLVTAIKTESARGHIILVESLAERVAALALQPAQSRHVTVKVEKLDAIDGCQSVGITLHRSRRSCKVVT